MTALAASEPGVLARPAGRLELIDVARGLALLAMALYHLFWDLSFLKLIETQVATAAPWPWAARAIAGSFLFLVGVSLVLAHGDGLRWHAFLRRLGMILAAAAAVTLVTFLVFPESYIFFGILHCIALSSLLTLPFLRAPLPLVALSAAIVLSAPLWATSPAFDAPLLAFLGLGTRLPVTNDYVPLFPWFGMVLAGLATARVTLPWLAASAVWRWQASSRAGRALAWAGRHSLSVYLIHQPILLAVLYPLSVAVGPHPAAEAAPFIRSCETQCVAAGHTGDRCHRACHCTVEELRRRDLWARTLQNALGPDERLQVEALARQCFARAGGALRAP